jgi:hypothetical protein
MSTTSPDLGWSSYSSWRHLTLGSPDLCRRETQLLEDDGVDFNVDRIPRFPHVSDDLEVLFPSGYRRVDAPLPKRESTKDVQDGDVTLRVQSGFSIRSPENRLYAWKASPGWWMIGEGGW